MYQPLDEMFYFATGDWGWDENTKVGKQTFYYYEKFLAYHQSCLFEVTARTNATDNLPGKSAEVYIGFKKIEEVLHIYEEICEKADE